MRLSPRLDNSTAALIAAILSVYWFWIMSLILKKWCQSQSMNIDWLPRRIGYLPSPEFGEEMEATRWYGSKCSTLELHEQCDAKYEIMTFDMNRIKTNLPQSSTLYNDDRNVYHYKNQSPAVAISPSILKFRDNGPHWCPFLLQLELMVLQYM